MVRLKHRYIVIEVKENEGRKMCKLSDHELFKAVENSIAKLHGEFGVAASRSGFHANYCNELTRIAILRARLGPHKIVLTSLPFVTKLGKIGVNLRTLYVGATLHHCYRKILLHQKRELAKMLPKLSEKERAEIEPKFLNVQGLVSSESKRAKKKTSDVDIE